MSDKVRRLNDTNVVTFLSLLSASGYRHLLGTCLISRDKMLPKGNFMYSLLVLLFLLQLIAYGFGSYVMLERVPILYSTARDLELLLLLVVLIYLLWGLRKRPAEFVPQSHHWALLLYALVLLGNCFRPEPIEQKVLLGALQLSLIPFVYYALSAVLIRLPAGMNALLLSLAFASVVLAIPAFAENLLGLVSMERCVDFRFEDTMTRATGFLANPIILGSVYQILLLWVLGFYLQFSSNPKKSKIALILLVMMLFVVYISYTRAAWLALGFSCILLYFWVKPRRKLIIFIPLLLFFIVISSPTGRMRFTTMAEMKHRSNATRLECWSRCFEYILERPLVGHGLGRSCGVAPNQNEVENSFYAHNYLLQLWVELGLLGLISFLLFLCLYVRNVMRREMTMLRKAGLAALSGFALHSMVIGHIEYPPVAVVLGISLALLDSPLKPETLDSKQHKVVPKVVPAIAILVFLAVLQMRVAFFQYYMQRALVWKQEGRHAAAVKELKALKQWNSTFLEGEYELAKRLHRRFIIDSRSLGEEP